MDEVAPPGEEPTPEEASLSTVDADTLEDLYDRLSFHPSVPDDQGNKVHRLCLEVLSRMPSEAVDELLSDHSLSVYWLRPGDSLAEFMQVQEVPDPDSLPEGWGVDTSAEYFRGVWVIVLAADLPSLGEAVALGTIAHEFAHVVLRHYRPSEPCEGEADQTARDWGFTQEIAALRSDSEQQ